MRRLIYLANSRLPTEKAHGYQISKMCEAFAESGVDVLLLHPRRRQADGRLRDRSVFEYYGVRPLFEVRTLFNWDVVALEQLLPGSLFAGLTVTHALAWGLGAALYAKREGADLYYTRDVELAFWLTHLGLPTALELHILPKQGRQLLVGRVARSPFLRLVVTLTSFGRDSLIALGVPESKIAIHPSGVDLSLFEDLPTRDECRRRLGLPLDCAIVGYIGRFEQLGREKGIPDLIGAMGHVPRIDDREPLLLCVGGPMSVVPTYMDLATRHGVPPHRLRFVDHVAARDVPLWIRACDVATVPLPDAVHYTRSISPLKVFEYMAAEAPIVATRLPSIEQVLCHGKTAWLVEPGSAKALGDGIASLLRDPADASRMARRARQEVSRYAWARRAGAILEHSATAPALGQAEIA
jgi:glycosyltransferase involved in cell wall biosynthesis